MSVAYDLSDSLYAQHTANLIAYLAVITARGETHRRLEDEICARLGVDTQEGASS